MNSDIVIFWHRRDLRLHDNAGAFQALQTGIPVLPLFIFDTEILNKLEDVNDPRVTFIHKELQRLQKELEAIGSTILVKYGKPIEVWQQILQNHNVVAVYTNRDYEPYAQKRDATIAKMLDHKGIPFHTFKDHVVFEKLEVTKKDGKPYTVFTPYSRVWKAQFAETGGGQDRGNQSFANDEFFYHYLKTSSTPMPTLAEMGFEENHLEIPDRIVPQKKIKDYEQNRNFPAIAGTSKLGIHFRFGTISIREKVRKAKLLNDTYLNELIWRDFYAQILANFPHVAHRAFRPEYDYIEWRNNESEFEAWCAGQTGYPMADAGMRELNHTGFMHNRSRMITASFLTKHLLIDWRWGEAYFARKLLDFDLASNNGGWQWAAGSGTDAAPYFRIFNPASQLKKFDKEEGYIRKWIPEYGTNAYPNPIVDHKLARERCLEHYKVGIEKGKQALGK
ncbi:MAG: deoxyribodipyrimidine photo-lyase [Saprospiraceae bacterium]|nr:deoxyribodipyrimidine photo-lyase [Saprospiraceae bacterium]